MSINVTIIGNATADAELRFTAQGKAVASFTVAVNERVKNEDGTWGDGDATFIRVSVWERLAQSVSEAVKKGTGVILTGKLKSRTYEDREGVTRTSLDLNADNVAITLKPQRLDNGATPATKQFAEATPF